MTRFIANARMYAVAPEAEAAWQALIAHVASEAEVALDYMPYPAPKPLEDLWRRPDLGCVQMCGYPIALGIAEVVPIAAPIPALPWAGGHAAYRSDLIVRADSPFRTLADSFGHRLGWTVAHSHSGFNALRHHLLPHWQARGPLYAAVRGELVTARGILDAVLDGSIDIGPLDGYWHALIARYRPDLTAGIRVLDQTALAPMPAFVAAPGLPVEDQARLRAAFALAASRPWFPPLGQALLIAGFSPVDRSSFATTLAWDRAAVEAGYAAPG
ncbi:phosphate/phosphite/phosphonate ABC transporter substrate-binding protein [Falsiroseomonas selenitidurans]|uniref:Phosphate/phosphite/phosphonate ABC transporter substrate-binding protein n=1 Tax=Falsiroseomonas selenitidurans TaxID=2716335 RepID=A0ABX1E4W8_9PROT|nr:PhnD/SsuA/transferrin family substrate-binding protein [Falsiroseomonas selenitidurans]NKC30848.1 phosphate/phosphite/phosphonate ABC transporter substrate-binding protein [Falsiroseomonas selenitidurans]